jgi:PAT family beta-lactamase induction signal transducer AmpG|tara:strand:+ start:676 stop:1923 length:1248 start_codon:yes stop_codon:yes gene_type:complete
MIKNLTIASLGFSSGLPYILIFSTLGVWLADIGIDLTLIGFFAWIVLTYSLKFLWAPLVDNFSIPILNRFGNRKSWILLSQSLIVICLILLSLTNPLDSLNLFAFIAFLVAFSGSIQDIAIDAFRIEVAELNQQGNLAASYQLGYRAAILISSSFALIFASEYGWSLTYQLMAILMFVGVMGVLICPEQANPVLKKLTLSNSILEPIKDFMSRFGIYLASFLLLIVCTYRLTDIVMGPMASPFYLDKGYTLKEIGYVVKVVAVIASIVGFFLGGILVKKKGVKFTLIIGALLVLITNLSFSVVALYEKDLALLGLIVGADSLAAGVVGTANITFLTSLVSKQYTAVQYALLTSFMMLPGKIFSGFSGVLASFFKAEYGSEYGWTAFFIFTSLLTIPCLFLLLYYARENFTHDKNL